jgi:dTDP-L-rhamnose 4-epimerase
VRVLVTGGAGFIGSHVVQELRRRHDEIRVLDDLSTGAAEHVPGADLVHGDVRDADTVRAALDGVEAVVHHAAKVGLERGVADLPEYVARNDLGTAVLLRELGRAGLGRLVLASSMVVYGEGGYRCPDHGDVRPGPRRVSDLDAGRFEPPCPTCNAPLDWRPVTEDAPLDPRNGYAATKVAQEHLVAAWARATGGAATALRYHNVYGPRMPRDTPYAGVAALFRAALSRGEAPRVFEDGQQRRDFVHVRDVALANALALERPGPDGLLRVANIASGVPATVGEVADGLAYVMGGPRPVVTGEYRAGDVRHVVAAPDQAAQVLGFRATVPLSAGLAELARVESLR